MRTLARPIGLGLAARDDPDDVGPDHQPLSVEAVGCNAGGEGEQRIGHEARERRQPGLRR
jgi:hypothetical protein